ncbi:hypothetical protein AMTR_s00158p00073690 [Amborella trichopoda]|uniref:Uncharacterized protein n=1 Tax=Amborella trichopoda TaxID=13333 RepID=W1PUG9_AMBTC|nr:hypothetical protein AMTR_s00158p00073690 [Amborella trichopoda]
MGGGTKMCGLGWGGEGGEIGDTYTGLPDGSSVAGVEEGSAAVTGVGGKAKEGEPAQKTVGNKQSKGCSTEATCHSSGHPFLG